MSEVEALARELNDATTGSSLYIGVDGEGGIYLNDGEQCIGHGPTLAAALAARAAGHACDREPWTP